MLHFSTMTMPAASLGRANPLPALARLGDGNTVIPMDDSVQPPARDHIGFGAASSALPYLMLDGYDRRRTARQFRTAVLENDRLRATFLLELGGRLWSLFDKKAGRELLYVNPVFQPANLAVRGAWFSGGVEWNASVPGHTPLTCDPTFVARTSLDDGTPVLRLYEFERTRAVVYQVDAWLPQGSPVLLVRVRLANTNDHMTPTYWWSNIAVAETPHTRVLVPAEEAISSAYFAGKITQVKIPAPESGVDACRPGRLPMANDFFFLIPQGERPFIAAIEADGAGLVQTSTSRLCGRKEFAWGRGPGGKRWQQFLTQGDRPYLEIQAGLAATQYGCLQFPAGERWDWLEAYGLLETDAAVTQGPDWRAAVHEVRRRLNSLASEESLEQTLRATRAMADREPEQIVQHGSGFGALEERRRGGARLCAGTPFPAASLGPEQEPWLALLSGGTMPPAEPWNEPVSWMTRPEWRDLLEASVRTPRGSHAAAWLHLGVLRYMNNDYESAAAAWRESLRLQPTAWAYRNLAVAAQQERRLAEAADLYEKAVALFPTQINLVLEACALLLLADRPGGVRGIVAGLPAADRLHPRAAYYSARAALGVDDLEAVAQFFEHPSEIVDLREGDQALSDLWFAYQEKRLARSTGAVVDDALRARVRREFPPPAAIDFRMAQREGGAE